MFFLQFSWQYTTACALLDLCAQFALKRAPVSLFNMPCTMPAVIACITVMLDIASTVLVALWGDGEKWPMPQYFSIILVATCCVNVFFEALLYMDWLGVKANIKEEKESVQANPLLTYYVGYPIIFAFFGPFCILAFFCTCGSGFSRDYLRRWFWAGVYGTWNMVIRPQRAA